MFKRIDIVSSLKSASIAALLFSICVFIYIKDTTYAESWLLFLGSFLFFVVIVIHTMFFNKVLGGDANTVTLVFASHVVTFMGVVISCILSFILLSTLVPGYLSNGPAGVVAPDAPPNAIHDKTNGLSFRIFIGAIIFNFSMGSFAGIVFPFMIKRNQTKDSGEPYPLHQQGADNSSQ